MNALLHPPGQLACTDPVPAAAFARLRRHMMLEGCKWDVQVGDVSTLLPFALVLPAGEAAALGAVAEQLAAELAAVESALQERPSLWSGLGLPRRVRRALDREAPWTPSAARILRFDFHPTPDGWRISEVNSDVPGGYNEAGPFSTAMAAQYSGTQPAGDPLAALADALARTAATLPRVALLSAPGYAEDFQVVSGLARGLADRGIEPVFGRPAQLLWRDGLAHVPGGHELLPVGAIFRFHQGEWMTRVPGNAWLPLFRGGRTPVCNPAGAILTESKRLPLLWDQLAVSTPAWRRYLPAVDHPRAAVHAEWILKAAYGNTGDDILGRVWPERRGFVAALASALIRPGHWVAQRRFESQPVPTPAGAMHLCLGVYVANGRAAGIYGRMSPKPVIDYTARDVAVLLPN